ncbi:MAG TPA: hypothetical protein VFX84_01590 [Candidatus Saccharimonadales bacterium]|nr:hypothetical protein [Candidatus Saccharimonadales bacterium]
MSSPTNKKTDLKYSRERGGGLAWLSVLLAMIAVFGVAMANRQDIYDWIRLRGYDPPPAVVKLADQDGMKDYTRHLFYLNRPQILSTVTAFRQSCTQSENTIVLGCYHPGDDGIYIYDVQDPELAGVEQVTAAHEVLHAIYERLSDSERSSLDKQLEDFYEHGLKDQRVRDEIKLYQKNEPGEVVNEMSCIFGTEVAELPDGLEAYYSRYFEDRSAIVAYSRQYESEFTRREAAIKQYDSQLDSLKQRIDAAKADLQNRQAGLESKQAQLNAAKASGDTDAYNAGVPEYNRLVDEYNAGISSTKLLVARYNRIVEARNDVARELASLAEALDTRLPHETTR